MLRCVKNTVLLFINMPISWWKLYNKTCQEEINKLMCSWYMMRVHRDVEKTGMDWIALCKQGSDRSSPEIYLYIYPHINSRGQQEDYKLTFMGQYEHSIWPGYHKVASLEVLNGSWSTKLIKYHGLNAFSCKQLHKLIILVVLLCPLYSIVYAIFEKHKNIIKMALM